MGTRKTRLGVVLVNRGLRLGNLDRREVQAPSYLVINMLFG